LLCAQKIGLAKCNRTNVILRCPVPIFASSVFSTTVALARRPLPRRQTWPRPVEQLIAPVRDLVRVLIELLRELDQRLLAPYGCTVTFA